MARRTAPRRTSTSLAIGILLVLGGLLLLFRSCGPATSAHRTASHETPTRVVPTPTPTVAPLPSEVELPPGSAGPMAVSGNTLVWSGIPNEGSCPRYALYRADLAAFHPRTIWTSTSCSPVLDIRISRKWIVWSSGKDPAGRIWVVPRAGGRPRVAADQPFDPANHPCLTLSCVPHFAFSLDGDMLVWSHFTLGTEPDWMVASIEARRLPNGRVHTLYQTAAHCQLQIDPQLSQGRLVWLRARWPKDVSLAMTPSQQCEGPVRTDVMSMRLASRFAQALTGSGEALDPRTNGSTVFWLAPSIADAACACESLWMQQLATGQSPKLIAHDVTGSVVTPSYLQYLVSNRNQTQVEVMNLKTEATTSITTAGPSSSASFIRSLGWGTDNLALWEREAIYGHAAGRGFVGIKTIQPQ